MVEAAGIEDDARRARRPGGFSGGREHVRPKSFSDVRSDQAEVLDFDVAIFVALELEVSRGYPVHGQDIRVDVGLLEVLAPLRKGPAQSIAPMVIDRKSTRLNSSHRCIS